MRLCISRYYKNRGKTEWYFAYFVETHHLREAPPGVLTEFLHWLHDRHRTPLVKLYFFKKKDSFVPISLLPDPPDCPFILLIDYGFKKFSIFLPQNWITELNEEEIKWLLCHELGHALNFYKEIFIDLYFHLLASFSRKHSWNYYTRQAEDKKDTWANAFATHIMGKEKSICILEKMRKLVDSNQMEDLNRHIAEIKEKITYPQNPLNLN